MHKIEFIEEIAEKFDCFILDQFGTIHDGTNIYKGARDVLAYLQEREKKIMVISNSGKKKESNILRMKEQFGLDLSTIDFFITSGDYIRQNFRQNKEFENFRMVYLIKRSEKDGKIIGELGLEEARNIDDCDFILITGLNIPDVNIDELKSELDRGLVRNKPMICANPDKKMIHENRTYPAAGAMAEYYQKGGGKVYFYGKPHFAIFEECLRHFPELSKDRVLMVGDSLEHDVGGAANFGIKSLFLLCGIHGLEEPTLNQDPSKLSAFCEKYGVTPDYYTFELKTRK